MTIDERIGFLVPSIESHDRQIGELTDAVTRLVAVSNEDANAIHTLARIAEAHENRIFSRRESVASPNPILVYPEETYGKGA